MSRSFTYIDISLVDLINDDVGHSSEPSLQLLQQHSHSTVQDTAIGTREDGVESHAVTNSVAEHLAPLLGYTFRDGDGADTARLGDDDVTLRPAALLDVVVKDVLRDLCSFSTSGFSSDEDDRVLINGCKDLIMRRSNRQLEPKGSERKTV